MARSGRSKFIWSPDSKYLVLFFDHIGFIDVIGVQRVAVINVETHVIQLLDGEYLWPFSNPWRPQIHPIINN
jgi:hypothetical protein